MRRWTRAGLASWTRVGLVATATLVGVVALTPAALTPAAHAAGGTTPSAPKTNRTKSPGPLAALRPELLTCIAAQANVFDRVTFSRVCKKWRAATHQVPVSLDKLKVARTQAQLNAALKNAETSAIVIIPNQVVNSIRVVIPHQAVIPHQGITIKKAPANPQAHITIHDTKTRDQSQVEVRADMRVTATGTAKVKAHGHVQVTASGNTTVWAYGHTQVTATGTRARARTGTATATATVWAYDDAQVTATGTAKVEAHDKAQVTATDTVKVKAYGQAQVTADEAAEVAVCSADCRVVVHSSAVHLEVTDGTRSAVQLDKGVIPTIVTLIEGPRFLG